MINYLLRLDTKLYSAIHGLAHRWDSVDAFFIFIDRYGVGVFVVILFLYVFFNRRIFLTTLASVILSRGILTELVRFFYFRPRPFVALSDKVVLIQKDASAASFPSGHTAFYFAVAFAVFLQDKKVGSTLIGFAALLSLARVVVGVHYPGDILGGIAVAAISSYLVNRIARKIK